LKIHTHPHKADSTVDALLDLIPFGRADQLALSVVAANIQAVIGMPTHVLPYRADPEEAYLAARRQYDAIKILNTLSEEKAGALFKLGVLQHDLCIPILTYVYGESQLGGHAAVISLSRLYHLDRRMTCERGAKIGLHEVGHLLGLEHCRESACLMRFSKQLAHLDLLPLRFCPACEYEIARLLKRVMLNGR
jgi:archaemetzincin